MAKKVSKNAERVAKKVVEKVRNGEIVKIGEIMRETGYSDITSRNPQRVTRTMSYIATVRPVLEGIDLQIEKVKVAMANKDLSQETYATLNYSLDTLIRNQQLLSGGATERNVFVLPSEVLDRNGLKPSE